MVLEGVSYRSAHSTHLPATKAQAGRLTAQSLYFLAKQAVIKYLPLELPFSNFGDLITTFMTDFYLPHIPPVLLRLSILSINSLF